MSELEKLNAIEILSESETASKLKAKGAETPVKMDHTIALFIPPETIKTPRGSNEKYEVTVQFGEGKTYIGKETYSLRPYPLVKNNSLLAQFYRAEILQGLSLDRVVSGMISSADLINLAYWAFAARGTDDLLADLHELQMKLREATITANKTMSDFGTTSESVVNNLISAFDTFADVDEDTTPEDQLENEALQDLKKAAASGKEMARQSKALADEFGEIIGACSRIIKDAIKKKVHDEKTREELEARVDELQSLITSTNKLQEQLVAAIGEAEDLYQDAKDREAEENDRGFITGLVGSIFGGLASAASSVALTTMAIKSPVGLPGAAGAVASGANTSSKPGTNKPEATTSETEDTAAQLKKANKKLLEAKKKKNKNDTKIQEAEKIIAEATDADVKQKAQDTKDEAEGMKEELDRNIEQAQKEVDAIVSVANSLANLAATTSESFNQLSQNTYNAAAEASKQKMEFYRQKIKLAEENRKALSDIALYTSQVQYTSDEVTKIKTAIQSLEFAISALNRVVAALTETEQFWTSLAKFCDNRLGSTDFADKVQSMVQKPAKLRMQQYRDEFRFVLPALQTIAYWVAVKNVSKEYHDAVIVTLNRIKEDIKNRPSQAEAQKGLGNMANRLLADTEQEVIEMNMNIAFYEEQMLQYAVAYSVNNPNLKP